MNNVRPHLTLLTEEQKQEVHQRTIKVLENTGLRVDSPSALEYGEVDRCRPTTCAAAIEGVMP